MTTPDYSNNARRRISAKSDRDTVTSIATTREAFISTDAKIIRAIGRIAHSTPAARRTVTIKYFECSFCGETYDHDDPRVAMSPNDCRERCPRDQHRLTQLSAGVIVG